ALACTSPFRTVCSLNHARVRVARTRRARRAVVARSTRRARPSVRQILMERLDATGTLADGRGNPLDRATADVAGREHPGDAGLQRVRLPLEQPALGQPAVPDQARAGLDESPTVPPDLGGKPAGARYGSDEDEERLGSDLPLRARAGVAKR